MALSTPVLLIMFNRPDTTQRVFDAVRQAKPQQLLVAADGPRKDRDGEAEKCRRTREIVKQVDWDCEVRTLFQEENLGIRVGVPRAIDWFFENVEEGIILEHDCVPDPTFFRFCEELLAKYRDDRRIMMISGMNTLGKWKADIQSYHFSYIPSIWGWASWRRAWDYFDIDVKLWGEPEGKNAVRNTICDTDQFNFFSRIFDRMYHDKNQTAWDCSWLCQRLLYSGLSVVPSINLISYIGFEEGAAWSPDPANPLVRLVVNLPLYSVSFPLQHPHGIAPDRDFYRVAYSEGVKGFRGSRVKNALIRLLRVSGLYSLAVVVVRPLHWRLDGEHTPKREELDRKLKG